MPVVMRRWNLPERRLRWLPPFCRGFFRDCHAISLSNFLQMQRIQQKRFFYGTIDYLINDTKFDLEPRLM